MGVVHVVLCNYLDDGGVVERVFSTYAAADEYATKREYEYLNLRGASFEIVTMEVSE